MNRTKTSFLVWFSISFFLHVLFYICLATPYRNLKKEGPSGNHQMILTTPMPVAIIVKPKEPQTTSSSPELAKPEMITEVSRAKIKKTETLQLSTESNQSNTYYSSKRLSRNPELISEGPNYVEHQSTNIVSGSVLLRLTIDRLGRVKSISVVESTLPREIEGAIVLQFYLATYRPGEIDAIPVNSEMFISTEMQGL